MKKLHLPQCKIATNLSGLARLIFVHLDKIDHQTPPGVSLENYLIYLRLLDENCQ